MWNDLTGLEPTAPSMALVAAVALGMVLLTGALRRRRGVTEPVAADGTWMRRLLVAVAVAAAVGVAMVGGVRSFEAVSDRFGSPLVPLTADGMIVACTALRIAALTRGWRIPGALATTYLFIGGTVWLNVAAAHDTSDAIAHALAPISYAVLVEMLAHLLRLHLHLATPPPLRRRVAALMWLTSPVVSTRVWLHLARTGGDDPTEARALVQQLVRLSSRLRTVCPSTRPWPFGHARRSRTAALRVVRDGLLTAHDLANLLPTDGDHLAPGVLLARIDKAALACTAPGRTGAPTNRTATRTVSRTGAPHHPRTSASNGSTRTTASPPRPGTANGSTANRPASGERSDEELVAELRRMDGPLSGRQVMRALGVGTGRAKRLIGLAGQTGSNATKPQAVNGSQPSETANANNDESESADPAETRTSR